MAIPSGTIWMDGVGTKYHPPCVPVGVRGAYVRAEWERVSQMSIPKLNFKLVLTNHKSPYYTTLSTQY